MPEGSSALPTRGTPAAWWQPWSQGRSAAGLAWGFICVSLPAASLPSPTAGAWWWVTVLEKQKIPSLLTWWLVSALARLVSAAAVVCLFAWWDNVAIKPCCTHSQWGLFWLKACRFARYMYRKLICLRLGWGNAILCKLTFNHQLKKKILTPVGILGFVDIEAVSKWIIFIAPKPNPVRVYRCLEPDAEIKLLIMLITLNRTELCWHLWPYVDCSFSLTFWFPFQIKTGAPCRSERLAKYNQLLRWDSRWGRRDWEWSLVQNGCSTNAFGAQLSLPCLQNTLQLKTFNLTVAEAPLGWAGWVMSWMGDVHSRPAKGEHHPKHPVIWIWDSPSVCMMLFPCTSI